MPRPRTEISEKEKKFVQFMVDYGLGPSEAARQILGWRCETGTREVQKAQDLARTSRCKRYKEEYSKKKLHQVKLQHELRKDGLNLDRLREVAFKRLMELANDPNNKSQTRYNAVQALDKLVDPSKDVSLILRWLSIMWRGMNAHCPCCHKTFPLWKIENEAVYQFSKEIKDPIKKSEDLLERRIEVLRRAEKRKKPHVGQLKALQAPERHIVGLGAARCLEENERVILYDGRVLPVKELKGTFFTIPAFGVLGKQVPGKAYAEDNGIKPVYRVSTENGKEILRTGNHPLLVTKKVSFGQGRTTQVSGCKWANIETIKPGDLVALPRKLQVEGSKKQPDEVVKLAGYLLGDGGLTNGISFTQVPGNVRDEFQTIVESFFNCKVTTSPSNPLTFKVTGLIGKTTNYVMDMVKSWGLYREKSSEKYFPDWVWELPNTQLALFLNRLYACDGWASKSEIGISFSSERMVKDVELALLRLGINGRFRYRTVKCTNGKYPHKLHKAWRFDITRRDEVIKFCNIVGIFGKEDAIEKVRCKAEKKKPGDLWKFSGLPENYEWCTVKSITYEGEKPTINICVDTYHTFVTTFVEHNSGKSFLLAMMAYLAFLIPGTETWILARVYEDARSEVDYLQSFLRTAFGSYYRHIISSTYDRTTGELIMNSKWGSELRVRSAKSKGSITGRELELALIAEPGWVPDDIFNHLRARMSSRLGRMVLLGTPQGYGGILGRIVNLVGRDPKTGRIIRIPKEKRTIEAGCPWNISMLVYNLDPSENPEYVQSELQAARMELTDSEYASEFEGQMAAAEGAKFPQIKPRHCITIGRNRYADCSWVLGVDQGPKNFAWVLTGFDGTNVSFAYESYDPDERTMKAKLVDLRSDIMRKIKMLGGNPDSWVLTIFDTDPPLNNELSELESEGMPWPTEVTWKHRNSRSKYHKEDWRSEVYEYINELALQNRLVFDVEHCYLLHDQFMRALNNPLPSNVDDTRNQGKGWIVNDPWRGDHVLDAAVFSVWTILSGMIKLPKELPTAKEAFSEAKSAFEYDFIARERKELAGYSNNIDWSPRDSEELWEETFGRPRTHDQHVIPMGSSPYKDY